MKNENKEKSYFKLGLFILIGLILIVSGLIIFGAGKIFERTVNVETYFDESIQGITKGSPVKYRGMRIGYVKEIAFASEVYKDLNNKDINEIEIAENYIYVKIAIISPFFTQMTERELHSMLERRVSEGLRIKLTMQGLTGVAYLELNVVDPQRNIPLKITWQPKNFYIPSTPSMFKELTENMQNFFNEFKAINFQQLLNNISIFIESAQHVAKKTNILLNKSDHLIVEIDRTVSHINVPLEMMLQNLQITSDNLRSFSEQIKRSPSQLLRSSSPPPLDPGQL
ncbi:MAG: MCE family protein [Oligoflexia bacterium]|nr:MCE family protein [Oligoflexia bacterium]